MATAPRRATAVRWATTLRWAQLFPGDGDHRRRDDRRRASGLRRTRRRLRPRLWSDTEHGLIERGAWCLAGGDRGSLRLVRTLRVRAHRDLLLAAAYTAGGRS